MKYLFLLNDAADGPPRDPASPEYAELYAQYGKALTAMQEAGVLIDCAPLTGWSSATTVRVRDGETMMTDGPAAEIKEQCGGYTLLECADLDEALRYAAMMPAAWTGSVEVRTVIYTEPPR
jgi:hypothetical protein